MPKLSSLDPWRLLAGNKPRRLIQGAWDRLEDHAWGRISLPQRRECLCVRLLLREVESVRPFTP